MTTSPSFGLVIERIVPADQPVATTVAVIGPRGVPGAAGDQTSIVGITGTLAQFNTAVTDADLVSQVGAETLSGKTLAAPVITGYLETVVDPAAGTSFSPDLSTGTIFNYDTSANATLNMPTAVAGQSFSVRFTYGGAHSLTIAGATVEWPGHAVPTWSSANGKVDILTFACFESGTWSGAAALNMG